MLIQSDAVCTFLTSKLVSRATPSGLENTAATGADTDATTGAGASDSGRQADGSSYPRSKGEGPQQQRGGTDLQQGVAEGLQANDQASHAR